MIKSLVLKELGKIPATILREQGYEIVEAQDGTEAVNHLKEGQPFNLLFTDVVLPGGMSGVQIAAQAKDIQPNIKVLYTTGYTESAVVHQGQLDPGVTMVNKPYRRAELLEKVRGFGGAQSYPSRTKDIDDVDFSTGSVGLGVAITAKSIIYCRNP